MPSWSARVSARRSGKAAPSSLRKWVRGSLRFLSLSQPVGGVGEEVDGDRLAVAPIGRDLQDRGAAEAAVGEQGGFAESCLAGARDDLGRDARQGLEQGAVGREGERDQRRARLDDLVAEAAGDVIGEAGRAELGDRQAAGGEDQPRSGSVRGHEKRRRGARPRWPAPNAKVDPALRAFVHQHGDDLLRRAVAEQLAEGLFVPGDAVARRPGR